MNVLGKRSIAERDTCHADLQKVIDLAIKRSDVDFGLHQGARTVSEQQTYFDNGKSGINPKKYSTTEDLCRVAKHIVIPGHPKYGKSRAIDLHCSEKYNGKSYTWDGNHLSYIAGVFTSCAKELYEKGEISHIVRWGGDWDSDGIIGYDHKLKDFPHLELIKPKTGSQGNP